MLKNPIGLGYFVYIHHLVWISDRGKGEILKKTRN